MNALEFQADMKDGTIAIPVEYRGRVRGTGRVIIRSPERLPQVDMIDRLLAEPLKLDHFQPLARQEI
jgi:hypothetical protein